MILIDSNVLFDLLSDDPIWYRWSASALAAAALESHLAINPVIYAETSVRFKTPEEFDELFPSTEFRREPLPYAAAFLAAKAHLAYRRSGGVRTSTLPDFFYRRACCCRRVPSADQGCKTLSDLFSVG